MNPSRSRSTSNSSERKWSEDVKPSVTLSHVVHPSCRSLSRPGDTTLTYRGNKFVRPSVGCSPCQAIKPTRGQPSPPVLITASQPFPFLVRTPRGGYAGPLSPASPRVSLDLQLTYSLLSREPLSGITLSSLFLPCH